MPLREGWICIYQKLSQHFCHFGCVTLYPQPISMLTDCHKEITIIFRQLVKHQDDMARYLVNYCYDI